MPSPSLRRLHPILCPLLLPVALALCLPSGLAAQEDLRGQTEEPAAAEESHPVRDGHFFDPGVTRTEPAEGAPADLAKLAPWVGDWDLTTERRLPPAAPGEDPSTQRATGRARITYMNRGHGLLVRTRLEDFDGQGHPRSTLAFVALDGAGTWTVSEGDSWSESMGIWSGGLEASGEDGKTTLILHDADRPAGGPTLVLGRRTYTLEGEGDRLTMTQEASTDLGTTWSEGVTWTLTRREAPSDDTEDFFPVRQDPGLPAPSRPAEAAQFDFLVGEFDARHWQRTPNGQERRWTSDATAVHVLDGHAILEFDHHDNDPTLPDAATSILRMYNRATRQWESLYLTNRGNRPLHFGGVQEGDGALRRIVLHMFDVGVSPRTMSEWIFYDIQPDTYRWKGQSSPDRGETWTPGWTIELSRKGVATGPSNMEMGEPTQDGTP